LEKNKKKSAYGDIDGAGMGVETALEEERKD
jgi:hypothetical protein